MYSYHEVLNCSIRPSIIFVFFVFYVSFVYHYFWNIRIPVSDDNAELRLCYEDYEHSLTRELSLVDIFDATKQPISGHNIFFVDTSCGNPKHTQWTKLNARQACAVESAARHNNNSNVYVLFLRPVQLSPYNAVLQALKHYKNLHLLHANLWRLAKETPAEEILNGNEFFQKPFLTERLADLVRLLTLRRWRGLHLDFETLTLRSLQDLTLNFGGWQAPGLVGSGVLNFAVNGTGPKLLNNILYKFVQLEGLKSFSRTDAATILTNVLKTECFLLNNNEAVSQQCLGFHIKQKKAFYELALSEWKKIFMPAYRAEVLARTEHSYILYTWGKWIYSWSAHKGDNSSKSAFDVLASRHCPLVFQARLTS